MNRYNTPHFNGISTAAQRRNAVDIDYQWEQANKVARVPFMFIDEEICSTADIEYATQNLLYERMVRRFMEKGNHIPLGAQIVVLNNKK